MEQQERHPSVTAAYRAVHNQPSGRVYTVAEVKQIIYPLIDALEEPQED
jgi:hypothetical protein